MPVTSVPLAVFDRFPVPLFWKGADGRFVAINRACEEFLGMPRSSVIGRTSEEVLPPAAAAFYARADAEVRAGTEDRAFEYAHPGRDGEVRDIVGRRVAVPDPSGLPGVVAVFLDVTEARQAWRSLRGVEHRLAAATRVAADAVWEWDPATDRVLVTSGWAPGLPGSPLERPLEAWARNLHPDDRASVTRALVQCAEGEPPRFELEVRLQGPNDSLKHFRVRGMQDTSADGAVRVIGVATEISAQRQAERMLQHVLLHDPTTGLANRALLLERLAHCRALGTTGAVAVLEVDQMRQVNQAMGGHAGDTLIQEIGRRIQGCAGSDHTVARLDAGEIVILAPNADETRILRFVRQFQATMAEPIRVGEHTVSASLSAGLAVCRADDTLPDDILRRAHAALGRARLLGRGHVSFFEGAIPERALRELELECELIGAVERGEMEVNYQPIVNLQQGRVSGFEALLRWCHPRLGSVPPGEFIPIAEGSGQIIPIGRWVLGRAIRLASEWQVNFPEISPAISVNVSARQLAADALVSDAARLLQRHPLRRGSLSIEVTESALIQHAEAAAPILQAIEALGANVSLDDFGTGYSSLAYLIALPISELKIDRSFVSGVVEGTRAKAVCRTIVQLGESLGLPVTAEGVETPEQLAWLRSLGCTRAQGYLFSKPVSAEGAAELLRRDPRW